MTIIKVKFALCPARFHVIYTDGNGKNKYAFAHGMGTCYTCRLAERGEP